MNMVIAEPEIRIPPHTAAHFTDALAPYAGAIEARAPDGLDLPLYRDAEWIALFEEVTRLYALHDHVVLRGLPALVDGAMLIAVLGAMATVFITYGRDRRIARLFAMNPWTQDLAHTAAEGFFHSDMNASPNPPALTGIQCIRPDPGAPEYGVNRVVRVCDILADLERRDALPVVHWLTQAEVRMANDRSPHVWSGRIVDNGCIRFHPETIRAAARRDGTQAPEEMMAAVQEAAFHVSTPLHLGEGDLLLLSNHRTLHYRGECSVVFRRFPTDFIARSIYVAHATDE
ncbi:MAG: TauD/TfdA family dioxygenase [Chromatiaceae bacterium]|nr:TauD/TfdA family dioxygenase [Chromatiaceae bacterium]